MRVQALEVYVPQRKHSVVQVSLLLPAYNEVDSIQETLQGFYNEIGTKIPLEIIVSEDGSTDGTRELLLELSRKIPMKLVLGEKRKGYMSGVKDGLKEAKKDFVFFADSDGQHVASDFWKLYENRNGYDMIIGRKIKRNDPLHRILISKVFHSLVRTLFRLPLHDPDTAFRLIRREVLESVLEETKKLKYSFWTEFTVRAFKKGFRIKEVPVIHQRRLNGNTRLYNADKLISIMIMQLKGLLNLWKELRSKGSPSFRE